MTNETEDFYASWLQDIKNIQAASEEGGNLEQIFTQQAVDLLAEAGETENVRLAYDEKALGTRNQHKINAWSISDNYETVDLFITLFKGSRQITRISKDETETAKKRITNFLRKAVYKEYAGEIDESSQIFDFAHTLSKSEELKSNLSRYNVFILTDGIYNGETPSMENKYGQPIFFRVVDINYLYNLSEKSYVPIEIDFVKEGMRIPCTPAPIQTADYQSYLAIIPGVALAAIYEQYGSRLLEQNVRSFLQFTGKINKGIRQTIVNQPHMFLAYNNGIAATAGEVRIGKSSDGDGYVISWVKDLQIVNGGQTTASIYHTLRKDNPKNPENIFVQLKLSVIEEGADFNHIVSKISEYSNTQNKVSVSDLSSNNPFHIELEKLSRLIVTPYVEGRQGQTRWFYERARGQFKNARLKEKTPAQQRAFDLKNPRTQLFAKEDIAKYINVCQEVFDGKKLVVGPHFVVRGGQKNYIQFMNFVIPETKGIDNIYFEDLVAKAILFRTAEKIYGVKPNAIGDLRYVTVPYSLSILFRRLNHKLDLYKIWRNQDISETMKGLLYKLMMQVEELIKKNAPGSLYGEWAKKEECWNEIKDHDFDIDFRVVAQDLEDAKNPVQRRKMSGKDTEQAAVDEELKKIKSISPAVWLKIEEWGRTTGLLTSQQIDIAFNMAGKVRNNSRLSDYERRTALRIIEAASGEAGQLFGE